ncbi:hypothetical protein JCM10908_005595 [Rhodotorula pacifica]|uniref:uncharacterized protein n=1 Tax=Rhodotorula pacifica TaxID=1495444 RepID=UPI00318022B0
MTSPVLPASPAAVAREREAQHRAELALLVSRLVPRPRPAVNLLLARALPSASEAFTPLKIGHDERNIDFWDERKFRECLKRCEVEQQEKLELTQQQVDMVKAVRKTFATACKDSAKELEEPEWFSPWLWPEPISDEVLLSRTTRSSTTQHQTSQADINIRDLLGAKQTDLGFTATAADLANLKRKREMLRLYHKKSLLVAVTESDVGDTDEWWQSAARAVPDRMNSASPPLFSRSYKREQETDFTRQGAPPMSPWTVKDEPSSPRFSLGDDLPPRDRDGSSPPTSEALPIGNKHGIRHFSPDKVAEQVPRYRTSDECTAEDVAETQSATSSPYANLGSTAVLASLDTLYDTSTPERPTGRLFKEAPYPHNLKVQVPLLPESDLEAELARVPAPCDFARDATTPLALAPMTGLRSLTLDLSWKAWSLPDQLELDSDPEEAPSTTEEARDELQEPEATEVISPSASVSALGPAFYDLGGDDEGLLGRHRRRQRDLDYVGSSSDAMIARCSDEAMANAQPLPLVAEAHPAGQIDEYGFTFLPPQTACSDDLDQTTRISTQPTSPAIAPHFVTASPRPDEQNECMAALSSRPTHSAASSTACTHPAPMQTLPQKAADNSSALNRFLSLRNKQELTRASTEAEPASVHQDTPEAFSAAGSTGHRDDTGSTPPPARPSLPPPQFLAAEAEVAVSLKSLRIVAFDSIFQQRQHVHALEQRGFHLVHRAPRDTGSSPPELIVDPTTCVTISRLVDVLKTTGKTNGESSTARSRTISQRVESLAQNYEHVVLVLEEQHQRVAGIKVSSYNKPVLDALDRLASAIADLRRDGTVVDVTFSRSPEHTAEIVAKLVLHRSSTQEQGIPVLNLWSERQWLANDPTKEEQELLNYGAVNELGACAILAVCSLSDFLGMSSADRTAVFASVVGRKSIEFLNHEIDNATNTSSDPVRPHEISAIDSDAAKADLERESDSGSFDWTEFLKELSPEIEPMVITFSC